MSATRLFAPEVPVPPDLQPAVEAWLAYKREQFKFTYKALALGALVEKLSGWGAERAMAAVVFSKAAGYRGVYEEKKAGKGGSSNGGGPPPWAAEIMTPGELRGWESWERHSRSCFLENLAIEASRRRPADEE